MRWAAVLLVLAAVSGWPQYRRRPIAPTNPSGAVTGVQGTLHGKLKQITSKEIVFQNEDDQSVSVRRTRKTRFIQDGREIKPSRIEPDTAVSIDVVQDIDLKPLAVTVTVDSAEKKPTKNSGIRPAGANQAIHGSGVWPTESRALRTFPNRGGC